MSYHQLFNRAYTLAISCNHYAIVHDLAYMSETELQGLIYYLTSMLSS